MLNCLGMFLASLEAEEQMDWGDVSFCDVSWLMDRCLTLSRAEPFCGRNTQLPNTTSYLYSGTPAQSEGQRESLCALQEGCTGLTCVPARAACSSSTEEEESCPLLAFLSGIAGTTLIFQMYFFYFADPKQTGEGVPCAVACLFQPGYLCGSIKGPRCVGHY